MSDQKPFPGQQVCRGIHATPPFSGKDGSPTESGPQPPATPISIPFQLVADFQVEAEKAMEYLRDPDLTSEMRSLFLAIITTPEALNRVCRLAVVSNLTEDSDRVFKGLFMGPFPEDIFESIRPHLPVEIEEYWTKLRREDCDSFEAYIGDIFEQFTSSLKNTAVIDITTGESLPLWLTHRFQPGEPPSHQFEVDFGGPARD